MQLHGFSLYGEVIFLWEGYVILTKIKSNAGNVYKNIERTGGLRRISSLNRQASAGKQYPDMKLVSQI